MDRKTGNSKGRGGRKAVFDREDGPAVISAICELVMVGSNLRTACSALGQCPSQVYYAMSRVRNNKRPSKGDKLFFEKYQAARKTFLKDTLAAIKANTKRGDSKHGLILLERMFKDMADPQLKKQVRVLQRQLEQLAREKFPHLGQHHPGMENLL